MTDTPLDLEGELNALIIQVNQAIDRAEGDLIVYMVMNSDGYDGELEGVYLRREDAEQHAAITKGWVEPWEVWRFKPERFTASKHLRAKCRGPHE